MSDLLYEVKDKVATITLNRPDKLNAFTGDMIEAWARSLGEAQRDDSVNVVIVTGAGRAFCSGGDVGRMRSGEPTALDGKNSLWEGVHRVPKQLEQMDKPVIAMVNGLAVGAGMGMCVMCDIRVAAESARFSTGYVRVGLVPGDGDTYFLPRLVGAAKALELLWTADFIEAPEAHRLGIVQRVVPDAQLKDDDVRAGPPDRRRPADSGAHDQAARLPEPQARPAHASRSRQLAHVDRAADGGPRRRRGRVQGKAPGEVLGAVARRARHQFFARGGVTRAGRGRGWCPWEPRGGRPPRDGRGWAPPRAGRTVMGGGNEFQGTPPSPPSRPRHAGHR